MRFSERSIPRLASIEERTWTGQRDGEGLARKLALGPPVHRLRHSNPAGGWANAVPRNLRRDKSGRAGRTSAPGPVSRGPLQTSNRNFCSCVLRIWGVAAGWGERRHLRADGVDFRLLASVCSAR